MTQGRKKRTTKIYKAGLETHVDNMLDSGYSYSEIIEDLKKHHNLSISKASLNYHSQLHKKDLRQKRSSKSLIAKEEELSIQKIDAITENINDIFDELIIECDSKDKLRLEKARKNILKMTRSYRQYVRDMFLSIHENYYQIRRILIEFTNAIPSPLKSEFQRIIGKYDKA